MNYNNRPNDKCELIDHVMIHWFNPFKIGIQFILLLSCSKVFLDVHSIYYVPRLLTSVFIYNIVNIQGYHSSILEWNHFRTSNKCTILIGITTINSLAFSVSSQPMFSNRCPFKFFVLITSQKNNQGNEHAPKYCLSTSKVFISSCFLVLYLDYITCISQRHPS